MFSIPVVCAVVLTFALFGLTFAVWKKPNPLPKLASAGAVYAAAIIIGAGVYNAMTGLPLDGAQPPASTTSLAMAVTPCGISDLLESDVRELNDKLVELDAAPFIWRPETCEATAPLHVVQVHRCEVGGDVCTIDGKLMAGVTVAKMRDGVVVSADVFMHGRTDKIICSFDPLSKERECSEGLPTAFFRLWAHEAMHSRGVGMTREGELVHAKGATSIMSDQRGPSWRWIKELL